MTNEEIVRKIDQYREQKNLNLNEFCEIIWTSRHRFYAIKNGRTKSIRKSKIKNKLRELGIIESIN